MLDLVNVGLALLVGAMVVAAQARAGAGLIATVEAQLAAVRLQALLTRVPLARGAARDFAGVTAAQYRGEHDPPYAVSLAGTPLYLCAGDRVLDLTDGSCVAYSAGGGRVGVEVLGGNGAGRTGAALAPGPAAARSLLAVFVGPDLALCRAVVGLGTPALVGVYVAGSGMAAADAGFVRTGAAFVATAPDPLPAYHASRRAGADEFGARETDFALDAWGGRRQACVDGAAGGVVPLVALVLRWGA